MESKRNNIELKITRMGSIREDNMSQTSTGRKDVNIGLDLLANAEKKSMKDVSSQGSGKVFNMATGMNEEVKSDRSEGFNFQTSIEERNPMANLFTKLDIDNSSRLGEDEIEKILNKGDSKNDNELEKLLKGKEETPAFVNDMSSEDYERMKAEYDTHQEKRFDEVSQEEKYVPRRETGYSETRYEEAPKYERRDPHEERRKKEELLFKFEKLRRLGIQTPKRFNLTSDLTEMEYEFNRITKQREVENSVKFQRKLMIAFTTGVEFLNSKFDMFDLKLDGWSEAVNENIEEYNEVFEELHDKYSEKVKVQPEIKLLLMLGGSAFMYHLTNTMFKSALPGMDDIMRQNPDLMKQFAAAAVNSMPAGEMKQAASMFASYAPGMGGVPSVASPPPPPRNYDSGPRGYEGSGFGGLPFNNPSGPIIPPMNMGPPRMEPPPLVPTTYREAVPPTKPVTKPRPVAKKEEKKILPPIGVDDILNELKTNTKDEVNDVISQLTDRKSLGDYDLKDYKIEGRSDDRRSEDRRSADRKGDDRRSEDRRSEDRKSVREISATDIMSEMASTVGGSSTVSKSRRGGKTVRTMTLNL